ncbi:MAG: FAD-dependent oxidoreductase, partial [Hyphomonadaceae bacterium]
MAQRPRTSGGRTNEIRRDVAIVGGGPVGLTLALALDQAGVSVAVVDAAAPETALAEHFDGRAFAIAFANYRMWRALGLGAALDPVVQPIEKIMVTDGRPLGERGKGGPSLLHLFFDSRELSEGAEPLGYMVENRHLRLALDEAVRKSNIARIAPMSVERFERDASGVTLSLKDASTIRSDLIVGCDGRRSFVRGELGIRTIGWRYEATAIVATVGHEKPHEAVAHEFFLPNGPFAILPLTGDRANIDWAEPPKIVEAILALSKEDFLIELKRRFGEFLGDVWLEG